MFNKKILIFLLIMCFIFTIGQVSANNNNDTHSFADLSTEINQTDENETLDLKFDYYKNNGNESPITINQSITINGYAIIDGNNINQIFNINKRITVTLNNLVLINGNSTNGGAIFSKGVNLNLNNCTFKNNTANKGGMLYINGKTVNINNCNFINNKGNYGGVIYSDNNLNIIQNSKFINNYGSLFGGCLYTTWKGRSNISNTEFINNGAKLGAGAILTQFGELYITKCLFENNFILNKNGSTAGGVIILGQVISNITDTIFKNNTATGKSASAGVIFNINEYTTNIINCKIIGNIVTGEYGMGSSILNQGVINLYNTTITNNILNTKNKITNTIHNINGIIYKDNLTIITNNVYKGDKEIIYGMNTPFIYGEALNTTGIIFPSRYDLRNVTLENGSHVSYITPIKDQKNAGACWVFGSISALESFLLYTNGTYYDLSENNIKNRMVKYSEIGWDLNPNSGGNFFMVLAYLLGWAGPVNESDDPFNASSIISPSNLTRLFNVQDVFILPLRKNFTDLNQMKLAIMKYGSITVDYFYPDHNTNTYTNIPLFSSHAVSIVGWDDNYSASNFAITPPGDGAFIIKNSHGTEIGENGYHYISYYDASLRCAWGDSLFCAAFVNVEDVNTYANNYQYDPLGNTRISIGFNNETAWMMNQFIAEDSNPLAAFGLYTYSPNSQYEAYVYVNDKLMHTQSGTIQLSGFNTIKLTELIPVSEGDVFKVAIKLTTPNLLCPIAIETQTRDTSKAKASVNQSFISKDGITWYDISQDTEILYIDENSTSNYIFCQSASMITLTNTNVCLKVYTVKNIINSTNLTKYFNNNKKFIVNIGIANETVIFEINGVAYTKTTNEKGFAYLNINLNPGNYKITTHALNYIKTDNISILSTIISDNLVKYYKNDSQFYIKALDSNGNILKNSNISFNINGVLYYRITDENGIAKLNINLNSGDYIITIINIATGEINSNTIKVLPLIETKDLVMIYKDGSKFVAKLIDKTGKILTGHYINFNINGIIYKKMTDSEGLAKLNINLNPGEYIISSENDGFITSNKITVKNKI